MRYKFFKMITETKTVLLTPKMLKLKSNFNFTKINA